MFSISQIRNYVTYSLTKCYWYIQYFKIRKRYRLSCCSFDIQKRSLILIPHADDEWIGCSQIIHQANCEGFYFNLVGTNLSDKNRRTRLSELEELSLKYSFPIHMTYNKDAVKNELLDLLVNENFDVIYIPSFVDWHNEHRFVNDLFYEVMMEIRMEISYYPLVCLYQVSVPLPMKWINTIVPLSKKEQVNKWKYFNQCYVSQKHLPTLRFKLWECIYGGNKYYAAEAFAVMPYLEWEDKYLNGKKNESMECLRDDINNIYSIHLKVNSIVDGFINV